MTSNTKEIAIATAFFTSYLEEYESFFNCVDKCYEMAVAFVEKYPPETQWGEGNNPDYEETLYEFYLSYQITVKKE